MGYEWVGDPAMIAHLAKHGVLDEADRVIADEAAGVQQDTTTAAEVRAFLKPYLT